MTKDTYIAEGEHSTHLVKDAQYWNAACGWVAAQHVVAGQVYDFWCDHSTSDVSKVTCHACLESAIKFGDAARDRFLELECEAGDAASEMTT